MSNSLQNSLLAANESETKVEENGDNGEVEGEGDEEQDSEPDCIEQYVWNLMGKSGLLSEIKSRIALFIQEQGGLVPGVSVISSRADPIILRHILEYLQWVGMKNTSSLLLSESPVSIDDLVELSDQEEPVLCSLFKNEEAEHITHIEITEKNHNTVNTADVSISDLLDNVQLDDNTQDISIESDSRGMSSCDHVVNLK